MNRDLRGRAMVLAFGCGFRDGVETWLLIRSNVGWLLERQGTAANCHHGSDLLLSAGAAFCSEQLAARWRLVGAWALVA